MNRTLCLVFVVVVCALPAAARADDPTVGAAQPRVRITISKETTYLTEPLRPDGYVDYWAALNRMHSEGVTPQNNAAVLFLRAIGPEVIPEDMRQRYFDALGVPVPPIEGDYLVEFDDFIKGLSPDDLPEGVTAEDLADEDALYDQLDRVCRRPWSAKKYPLLAAWVRANQRPLKRIVEASQRPRWYRPLVASHDDEDDFLSNTLIGALLPEISTARSAGRLLTARAMLRLQRGRADQARDDLLACHRFGRLVGRGGTLIEALVGIAIERMALQADAVLADRGGLTAEQLLAWRKQLAALPPHNAMADAVDTSERFMLLDTVTYMARVGDHEGFFESVRMIQALSLLHDDASRPLVQQCAGGAVDLLFRLLVDWDAMMRTGNTHYDQMVAAMRQPTRDGRVAAIDALDQQIMQWTAEARDARSLARELLRFRSPREVVTERISRVFLGLFTPAVMHVVHAEDKHATSVDMTGLVFTLAAYRADHGLYPERLEQLVPDYLAELPTDMFSGESFHYQQRGAGFLLYSVGTDGQDNGGRANDDRDVVIRVRGAASVERKR